MYFQKSHYIRDHFTEKISAHHLAHLSIIHQYSIKKCIGKNQHDLNSIVCKSSRSGQQPVQEEGICLDFNRKAQPPKTVVSKSWKQPLEWTWIDHYQSLQQELWQMKKEVRTPHKDLYWLAGFEFQFKGFFQQSASENHHPLCYGQTIKHPSLEICPRLQVLSFHFSESVRWTTCLMSIVKKNCFYITNLSSWGWGLKLTWRSHTVGLCFFHYFGQCKENQQPSLLRWKCSEAIQKLKSLLIFQASTCAWCRDPGLTPSAPMQWSSGVYLLN